MRKPKGFGKRYFSLAAILAFSVSASLSANAQSINDKESILTHKKISKDNNEINEDPIIVSKKIETKEVDATFASDIYTAKDIKNSHSKNLYDFLNTQTSITVSPAYGNPFSQYIDMRGYGIGNGYENIVVTLNGMRLNNIDMSPQLLSSIPLESIKKIEILKGNGSVEYGDGANAGVINIITKDFNGVGFKSYVGSHGLFHGAFDFGITKNKFSLEGYSDITHSDGDRTAIDGTKNDNNSQNKKIKLIYRPTKNIKLYIGKSFTNTDVRYPDAITLSNYDNKDFNTFLSTNHQKMSDDRLIYGLNYRINSKYRFVFKGDNENKKSDFITYNNLNRYKYNSYNSKVNYKNNHLKWVLGVNIFNGYRKNNTNKTTKNNLGVYLDTVYALKNNTFSIGARKEKVKYKYNASRKNLQQTTNLNAYEIGYNYKLTNTSSLFANYNRSFQAPDIDRFFSLGGAFNSFIKPMKVDNYTVGYNYFKYPHRFKADIFYANVKDEIYYNSATWENTNLDKTRKYGLEIEEKYNIHYNLYVKLNYSYIDTKIIKNSSNPAIEGNEIPGVSKHNLKVALGYQPNYKTTLLLSHVYRSKTYAMSDFDESFGKMKSFNSTDFSVNYKLNKLNLFAKINNIFDRKNALFVKGWAGLGVYPTNYERTFLMGVSTKF